MPSATCCCLSPLPFQFRGTVQFPPVVTWCRTQPKLRGRGCSTRGQGEAGSSCVKLAARGKKRRKEYLGDDLSSKTRDEPLPQKLYSSAIHFQTHKVVPLPLCTKRAKGSVNKQDIFKETPALNNTSSKEKSL